MKKNLWKLMLTGTFTLSQIIVPQFTVLSNTELFENKINNVHASVVDSGNCGTEGHESEVTWSLDSDGVFTVSGTGPMNIYTPSDECPWENYRDQIKKIIIDNGITTIGDYTFDNCNNLYSVNMPDSLTIIGMYAFGRCSNLTSVIIPENVTLVDDLAFCSCSSLSSVTFQGNKMNLGVWTFKKTPWLEEKQKENPLIIANNILILGTACSGDAIIPDNVTRIACYAFYEAHEMDSVIIPESVKIIDNYAFHYCRSLKSVTISEGTTSIKDHAFEACESLSSVTLPDSIIDIGECAFAYCDELVSLIIPKNVTYIDDSVFSHSWNFTSVFFKGSIPARLSPYTFEHTSDNFTIYVPADNIDDYKKAWNYYADIISADPSSAPPSDKNKKGDFDGDGKVDITDLSRLSLYLIGDREFTEAQIKAADVTGDGNTDLADLAHFKQFLSKKTEKFDAE